MSRSYHVWAFDFAQISWSEIATSGPPPSPRSNMAIAIVGGKLVVHGGNASTSGLSFTPLADLFVLDGCKMEEKPPERTRAAFPVLALRSSRFDRREVYHSTRDMEGSLNSPGAMRYVGVRNRDRRG